MQTALKLVLDPIWEAGFADQRYGCRPRRGCKDALRRVQELLEGGATWVVEVDLESYFDRIPHAALLREVEQKIADGGVLALLRAYLSQGGDGRPGAVAAGERNPARGGDLTAVGESVPGPVGLADGAG